MIDEIMWPSRFKQWPITTGVPAHFGSIHEKVIGDFWVIITGVVFAAIGQVSWKLGMSQVGQLTALNFAVLSTVLLNPYVLVCFAMYGLSTIFWLIALSKKDLSFVYPFISLTYVLVLVLSSLVLKESIGLNKIAGTIAIIIGLVIISKS